ncbi:MAG: methyltransferase domain-containing protein [Candidatus Hydrogenedentota bacterium]
MRKSTLSRFNSNQGAGNYKKKFDTQHIERIKNHSEQRLIERKIADLSRNEEANWVLDMPCGTGRFYPVLKKHFPRVVQADCSESMLRIARENGDPDAAGYLRLSALELPFRDQQFELVYSVRLCHHLPASEERRRYIKEILRVSRGCVVLSFLDTFSPHNIYRSFSRWLRGKPLKHHISAEDVADIAEVRGFAVVNSSLVSRMFSGQRYVVLVRASQTAEGAEAESPRKNVAESVVSNKYGVKTSEPPAMAECGAKQTWFKRMFRHIQVWRVLVIGLLLAVCLFVDVDSVEMDNVVLPLGAAIYAVGVGLRAWAQMHRDYCMITRKPFATTGPYRWVRNPLYLGNLAIIAGLAVFAETIYLAPLVLAVSAALYGVSAKREETRFERLCGREYREYRNAVRGWIPVFPMGKRTRLSPKTVWLGVRNQKAIMLALVPFIVMELFFT